MGAFRPAARGAFIAAVSTVFQISGRRSGTSKPTLHFPAIGVHQEAVQLGEAVGDLFEREEEHAHGPAPRCRIVELPEICFRGLPRLREDFPQSVGGRRLLAVLQIRHHRVDIGTGVPADLRGIAVQDLAIGAPDIDGFVSDRPVEQNQRIL
jgi:hypothetical protein